MCTVLPVKIIVRVLVMSGKVDNRILVITNDLSPSPGCVCEDNERSCVSRPPYMKEIESAQERDN